VYFYFDFTDPSKQTMKSLVTSVILQMSQPSDDTPGQLEKLYQSCRDGKEEPPLDQLCEVAVGLCSVATKEIYLVIDALDECPISNRNRLLKFIQMLAKCKQLRLFLTSRMEHDIEVGLDEMDLLTVDLTESLVGSDLAIYIRNRLADDTNLNKWGSEGKDLIEKTLLEGANGG
jgi:ankyrin repeat domain-containing protein 50